MKVPFLRESDEFYYLIVKEPEDNIYHLIMSDKGFKSITYFMLTTIFNCKRNDVYAILSTLTNDSNTFDKAEIDIKVRKMLETYFGMYKLEEVNPRKILRYLRREQNIKQLKTLRSAE
jgi:hypothetical protein